ncbi:MAG TPA: 2-polyprenylphenol 6-hydroxylase [Propylenella sp.]
MRNLLRLARAGFTLARAGFFGFAEIEDLPAQVQGTFRLARMIEPRGLTPAERGRRISDALNRLGPSYIKLGQFLATRPDIVGSEMADALSALKDDLPPFPTDAARAIVEASIGRPVEEIFESFSDSVAAASIAQVHKAVLRRPEGPEVLAIKVLRPGIRQRFARDLRTFYAGARFIERKAPESRRLRPVAVVEILQRSVSLEMDLRLEAAAYSEMAENVTSEADFHLPAVNWELTGRDVLVSEWVDGTRLADREAIVAAGHDPKRIAASVVQTFLRHALRDGFFHADMHEGNLFVDDTGRLVAVDLGIMGRIGPKERRFLAEILYGFIRRDYQRIAEVHIDAGYVPPIHAAEEFAQALRAIGEPIHGHRASEISMAKLLGLLFEVTDLFHMETRPELVLLQKTMVVVEGVARRLDPEFDMWTTAEPVVRDWMEQNFGAAGRLEQAGEAIGALSRLAGQIPELARRAERFGADLAEMTDRGVRLAPETVEGIGHEVARYGRSGRIALWVIALVASGAAVAASIVSVLR